MQFEFDATKTRKTRKSMGSILSRLNDYGITTCGGLQTRSVKEARLAVTGVIDEISWTAIVTLRGDDIPRIISVRRARRNERSKYG